MRRSRSFSSEYDFTFMVAEMIKFITDLFTERDDTTWCVGRILGSAAIIEMMVKFANVNHVDYIGFATGIAALIAAIAVKNYSEKENANN